MHKSLLELQAKIDTMESVALCPTTPDDEKALLLPCIHVAKQMLADLKETYRLIGVDYI